MSSPVEPDELEAHVDQSDELEADVGEPDELEAQVADAPDELAVELFEFDHVDVEVADEQGLRGPPGAPGPAGSPGRAGAPGGRVIKRALGPLASGTVVRAEGPLFVRAASSLDRHDAPAILGVAFHSVNDDEEIEIIVLGELEDSLFTFVPHMPVYLGPTGMLTQSIGRDFAFVRQVGVALSPTIVFVDLSPAIFLALE